MSDITAIVILPTYNEAGNIGPLIERILEYSTDILIVVVDDDSNDGTWQIVSGLADGNERVRLIRRKGRKGRGLAGKEGFKYAIASGVEYIIEMDADLSHDPAYIPTMLEEIKKCDMVIGSRFVPGGADERRSFVRKCVSRFARVLINFILKVRVTDPTSGYRCFSRGALLKIDPETLESETPFIILESLYRAVSKGVAISEVPIKFHPRNVETSKLYAGMLVCCFFDVIFLRARHKRGG